MRRTTALLAIGVALLAPSLWSVDSNAQLIPDRCRIYFVGTVGIPPSVDKLMRERHDSTAEACLDHEILHHYVSISAAFSGSFNICSYFKYEPRNFDDSGKDVTIDFFR